MYRRPPCLRSFFLFDMFIRYGDIGFCRSLPYGPFIRKNGVFLSSILWMIPDCLCCLCSYYRTFPDKIKSNFLFFYFFSKHPPSKQTKKAICAYTYRPLYISTRLHTKKATSFCRLNFHIFYSCTITISRTALFHRDYHYSSVRTQVQEAPSYYADACCVVSRPAFPLPHGYRSASS